MLAAILMHTHGSHGATDVTGFGPLGEAKKLVESQKNEVGFVLHTLPCIKEAIKVDAAFNGNLAKGTSAETSGGLLVILPKDNAEVLLVTFFFSFSLSLSLSLCFSSTKTSRIPHVCSC